MNQFENLDNIVPSYFKRLYGVKPNTFWKMVEVVRNAKHGSRGSHAKLSIPDQILLTLQYWREYRTYFHNLKIFRILSSRYRNRRKRFNLRVNLISGLYNYELRLATSS